MICGKELLKVFEIADNLGTNEKISLFQQIYEQDPIARKAIIYGSDSFLHFQMTSIPKVRSAFEHCNWDVLFNALDQLSRMRGASNRDREIIANIVGNCEFCRDLVIRILKHKLRTGMGIKNLRKAGFDIEDPDIVQLCEDDPTKFTSKELYFKSRKIDGFRVRFQQEGRDLVFRSRKGKTYDVLTKLFQGFSIPNGIELDGEIVSVDGFDHMASIIRSDDPPFADPRGKVSIALFDVPTLWEESLSYRQKFLHQEVIIPREVMFPLKHELVQSRNEDHFFQQILLDLEQATAEGYEGVVIKDPSMEYHTKRSNHWVKLKLFKDYDLPVIDIEIGTEGKTLGIMSALVVDFQGTRVSVGSGFSDQQRLDFMRNPPKVIEIKAQEVTKKKSLRFPIFKRVRDLEKDPKDVQQSLTNI